MESNNKKLVFITRPIVPPWDEGSKNLALDLAKKIRVPYLKSHILTTQKEIVHASPNIVQIPLYGNPRLTFINKLRLFLFIIKTDAQILHFIFVATPITSIILRFIFLFKKVKKVQTVVAFDTSLPIILKHLLYGDRVICLTRTMEKKIRKTGISHVATIPPGVDTTLYIPGIKKNIIAFLGELYRMESYDIVSKLIPLLSDTLPHYSIFLGFRYSNKPPQERILREQLQKKLTKVKAQIIWSDVVKDMPAFLKTTKLVVFPATTMQGKFNLPLVLIESLASGTPVAISPINPLLEYADCAGFITPSSNTASAFLEIIKNALQKKIYNALSKAARKTAINHFPIQKVVKQYEAIYKDLI